MVQSPPSQLLDLRRSLRLPRITLDERPQLHKSRINARQKVLIGSEVLLIAGDQIPPQQTSSFGNAGKNRLRCADDILRAQGLGLVKLALVLHLQDQRHKGQKEEERNRDEDHPLINHADSGEPEDSQSEQCRADQREDTGDDLGDH